MKFLFYSDLHLDEPHLEVCEQVLDEIMGVALDIGVDYTINGGDTFHKRGIIKTKLFSALYNKRKRWADEGIKNIDIIGNHDQADAAGLIHPMKVFEQFDGWRVIDKPWSVPELDMTFVPYRKNYDGIMFHGDTVIHAGICGAYLNDKKQDEDGIPAQDFNSAKKVFAGHYHRRQKIGKNIHYIGSPYQQNFGERDQSKGVLYYNQTTGKVTFIEIKGTPKYYYVNVSFKDDKAKKMKVDLSDGVVKGDRLKVFVKGTIEQSSMVTRAGLQVKFPDQSIEIDRDIQEESYSRLNVDEDEGVEGLFEKYVDFVEPDLDKGKLMGVFKEIAAI